jgi:BirA family biotin operon repressor/biotin-[acetyl-CoA-carboxylase] ligase
VEVLPSIDSTNEELMRRAKKGSCEPILLLANEQTAGKGRRGKTWHSRAGRSLTFSLGLHLAPRSWSGLSLVVGLAIRHALDPNAELGLKLKWPNDLWIGSVRAPAKLGGILIESHLSASSEHAFGQGRFCVIGIGINIDPPTDVELKMPAVGLAQLTQSISAQGALLEIVPLVVSYVQRFCSVGFEQFQEPYNSVHFLNEQRVVLSNGVSGKVQGVNKLGELMIHTGEALLAVSSDEVSLHSLDT